VRWVAAEGLIALGPVAETHLLRFLMKNFQSLYIREGAHHILHEIRKKRKLTNEEHELLEALRPLSPVGSVGLLACKALDSIGHSAE
jgi:hypothetical protein